MKKLLLISAVALCLLGCDAANELGAKVVNISPNPASMTLVIQPGYKMLVGGQPASVHGSQECPPGDKLMRALVGPYPGESSLTCVVIAPDTKTVSVTVGLPEGPSIEVWSVVRSGDRTMLYRADGTPIAVSK